jgi:hypothetical protein
MTHYAFAGACPTIGGPGGSERVASTQATLGGFCMSPAKVCEPTR